MRTQARGGTGQALAGEVVEPATAIVVTGLREVRALPAGATVDSRVWIAVLAAGTKPALQRGSTGPDVRRLQRALTAALGRTVAFDGIFGPGTEQAARGYQSSRKLTADGIVGANTWAALQSGRSLAPPPSRG